MQIRSSNSQRCLRVADLELPGVTCVDACKSINLSINTWLAGGESEILEKHRFDNREYQEQERNELEQEDWHGAIAMRLSENHLVDQSAFLDLCVSASASILCFFLLFLLLFYSLKLLSKSNRPFLLSKCLRLHFSICHFSICAAQYKANDMGTQNAQQNATRPFFTRLEPQSMARLKS